MESHHKYAIPPMTVIKRTLVEDGLSHLQLNSIPGHQPDQGIELLSSLLMNSQVIQEKSVGLVYYQFHST